MQQLRPCPSKRLGDQRKLIGGINWNKVTEIPHRFGINAKPDRVFAALVSIEGLRGWWEFGDLDNVKAADGWNLGGASSSNHPPDALSQGLSEQRYLGVSALPSHST